MGVAYSGAKVAPLKAYSAPKGYIIALLLLRWLFTGGEELIIAGKTDQTIMVWCVRNLAGGDRL